MSVDIELDAKRINKLRVLKFPFDSMTNKPKTDNHWFFQILVPNI